MSDQLHDERCKEPVAPIVCLASNPGPARRSEGAKREMEGQTDDPCRPFVHRCKLATIGPVFGGGSIHSSAWYRRHFTLAWITLTAFLLLWQGASLVFLQLKRIIRRGTSIGDRPLA